MYQKMILCHICLSTNRILTTLGEYEDIYRDINTNVAIAPRGLYVCWECLAVLRKVKLFKIKIEQSQKLLNSHVANRKKKKLQTLSNLTVCFLKSIDITQEIEIKEVVDIKAEQEPENSNTEKEVLDIQVEQEPENSDMEKEVVDIQVEQERENSDTQKGVVDVQVEQELENSDMQKEVVDVQVEQESENSDTELPESDTDNISNLQDIKEDKHVKIASKRKKTQKRYNNSAHYKKVAENKKDFIKKILIKENEIDQWLKRDETVVKRERYYCKSSTYTCDFCHQRFRSQELLNTHINIHKYVYECVLCSNRFQSSFLMNQHLKNTHSRSVVCIYCDGSFVNSWCFSKHFKEKHKLFICDHCQKKFRSRYMLEKHMIRHIEEYTCRICNKDYKTSLALRYHNALQHERSDDAYCVPCDKQFRSANMYQQHVKTSDAHASERGEGIIDNKVSCPECGNVYSRRFYMMNHYNYVHQNQSRYQCQLCDKLFLNRTRYVEHMKFIHEGLKREKNKLCTICGRGFADNRTLVHHIRTHSGERPFECAHCSAKFTQKYAMVTHVQYVHLKTKRRQ